MKFRGKMSLAAEGGSMEEEASPWSSAGGGYQEMYGRGGPGQG